MASAVLSFYDVFQLGLSLILDFVESSPDLVLPHLFCKGLSALLFCYVMLFIEMYTGKYLQ